MSQSPVDDMDLSDSVFESFEAGLDLGDHSGLDGAGGDELAGLVCAEGMDEGVRVVLVTSDAVHIAEEDEFLGVECLGDGGGRRVGVDIEFLPF